ncbi:hypothetical protein [Paenibacillus sp.]|uniref:hypothetical protein n=1 Tax=Paenibacillus sp. TaxID=58172 RepID=UPI002D29ED19|nr:hypothetical protein [Paenibacillus sp.]HZG55885.1 hypothetical protein [Paenibacillus sp.]
MNNRTLPLGLAIIGAGIVIALGKLGFFGALAAWFWPVAPLAAGVYLHYAVWRRTLPAIVYLPGALLVGGSLACLFCAWFGWPWMKALWPLFPLSLAVGLFELASAERSGTLRVVSFGIGAVSALAWIVALLIHANGYVVALLFIVVGVAVIARRPNFR